MSNHCLLFGPSCASEMQICIFAYCAPSSLFEAAKHILTETYKKKTKQKLTKAVSHHYLVSFFSSLRVNNFDEGVK